MIRLVAALALFNIAASSVDAARGLDGVAL
jgi:hypothetical protein